jgi:hypothetical protein
MHEACCVYKLCECTRARNYNGSTSYFLQTAESGRSIVGTSGARASTVGGGGPLGVALSAWGGLAVQLGLSPVQLLQHLPAVDRLRTRREVSQGLAVQRARGKQDGQ